MKDDAVAAKAAREMVEEDVLGETGGTAWEMGKRMTGAKRKPVESDGSTTRRKKKRKLEILTDWGTGGTGGDDDVPDVQEHENAVKAVQLAQQASNVQDLQMVQTNKQTSILTYTVPRHELLRMEAKEWVEMTLLDAAWDHDERSGSVG